MSDKEAKKASKASTTTDNPAIKCVSAFLSLENCENFIEKQNHEARILKLRTEGLAYIRETDFLYAKERLV